MLFKCSGNKYLVEKGIHWLKALTDIESMKLGNGKEEPEGSTGKTGNYLPGKGHSVQKKKVTREVVGPAGK